jgi:hypothetical protein
MYIMFHIDNSSPQYERVQEVLENGRGDGLLWSSSAPVKMDRFYVVGRDGKKHYFPEARYIGAVSPLGSPPFGFELSSLPASFLSFADKMNFILGGIKFSCTLKNVDHLTDSATVYVILEEPSPTKQCSCEIISLMNRGCLCKGR